MRRTKIGIRLPDDCLEYLDKMVEEKAQANLQWDRTSEIVTAIRQRMISKMTKADRERLYRRLGLGDEKREDSNT